MRRRFNSGTVVVCLMLLWLGGCSGSAGRRLGRASAGIGAATEEGGEWGSPEMVEKRVEAHARYAAAVLHDLNEEPKKAAEEYFHAALADVGNEGLVLEVSRRLLHEKMNEEALELLLAATTQEEGSGAIYARLGLVYSLTGKKELAIEANRRAIEKAPTALVGYQHLAQIHLQNGEETEALKVLDQAARQTEVDAAYLIELAELYLAVGRSVPSLGEEARNRLREVLDRAAGAGTANPLLLQKLADGYAMMGETEKAADVYVALLEQMPQMPGLRERLADLYLRSRDHGRAAEMLEAILRDKPTNPQAYYFLGSLAYDQKDMEKAADCFKRTVLLNPGFEQAYYDLAGAQVNLRRPEEALDTLQRAREKFDQNFVGEFLSGMAYSQLKQYTNAMTHLTAAEVIAGATETNRLNHSFFFQVGTVYERMKRYEEAEAYFRKALALSPDYSEALNYLGYMWADLGSNLEEAHEMIARAVKIEPENAAFLDSLAWVLFKLGRSEEALPYLLKAVEHSEEPDPTIYDHLGDVYRQLNDPDRARAAWRKALELEPSEAIRRKLDPDGPSEADSP